MEILGGPLFGVAGGGESHGPAIVTIVFGCPAGLRLSRQEVQKQLDRRRPGSSKHGTSRRELDQVAFLSGLYSEDLGRLLSGPSIAIQSGSDQGVTETYEEGFTTGEPIAAVVLSTSRKSEDYGQMAGASGMARPGHTDLVKHYKSGGFVDVRGGGRSSYRSTISDVVGGSIARIFLQQQFQTELVSSIVQVGPLRSGRSWGDRLDEQLRRAGSNRVAVEFVETVRAELEKTEIPTLDTDFAAKAAELIRQTRVEGDSLGAALEVVAINPPPLVGDPLYQSLKLRLMGSLGGLHAVQSCEMGAGFQAVSRKGSENNDPIRSSGYQANSHGGLLGGVTTGMPIVFRVGFKPTSSISKPQKSVRKNLEEVDFQLQRGRHDPCVGIRAGVTLESRMAIELMNAVLSHQASRVHPSDFDLF